MVNPRTPLERTVIEYGFIIGKDWDCVQVVGELCVVVAEFEGWEGLFWDWGGFFGVGWVHA